tara:strand:- start:7097 stop:7777 length:681 start_codon:yes stop_codon:yes gene_type:complete
MRLFNLILLISGTFFSHSAFSNALDAEALKRMRNNADLPFEAHIVSDNPESFGNALALNVQYEPVKALRPIIEETIGRDLKFLTAWNPEGEAHVTVITPPEYVFTLRHHISMERIHEIAREYEIQKSDIQVLGIGSAKRDIDGSEEETFFVIVDSKNLREIRYKIYEEYVVNGGAPESFDPTWFFPHITIGYTKTDLHENSGVLKNIKHSYDQRFGSLDIEAVNQD